MVGLKWEGRMEQFRGRLRETWGALTDDEIDRSDGQTEQLIGRIKERTGETTEAIRAKLQEIDEGAAEAERRRTEREDGF